MKYLIYFVIAILFVSCNKNPLKIDVSAIGLNMKLIRADKLLFETDTADMENTLSRFYVDNKEFTDIYTGQILRVGLVGDAPFLPYLKKFLTDTVYSQVADSVLKNFNDISAIESEIVDGFKHYIYYFPNSFIPKVYTHLSGFNQSVFTSDSTIGISLDKYLGRQCVFYNYLGIPKYKIENMYPEKMVADVFYSWANSEFENLDSTDNLLSNIVYHGKLHYFTEAMRPEMNDSINIGFSQQQLKWCIQNETLMWTYLIENKLLYSTERLVLQKYVADAPFTNTFSPDSPGRTGAWLGWQIVRSFMKNNKEVTLEELFKMNNAQQLLSLSRYFPQ